MDENAGQVLAGLAELPTRAISRLDRWQDMECLRKVLAGSVLGCPGEAMGWPGTSWWASYPCQEMPVCGGSHERVGKRKLEGDIRLIQLWKIVL